MLRLIISYTAASLLFFSCSDKNNYTPNVTINGVFQANPSETVYLNQFIDSLNRFIAVDSVELASSSDGKSYAFNTHIDSTAFIIITHKNSEKVIELIAKANDNISITYDGNDIPNSVKISGSEYSESGLEALLLVSKFETEKQKATQQLNSIGYTDTIGRKTVIRDFEVIRADFNKNKNALFNKYPSSLGLYVFLPYLNFDNELDMIQKVEQNFRTQVQNTSWHNYVKKYLTNAQQYLAEKEQVRTNEKRKQELENMAAVGTMAYDISLPGLDGEYQSLSSLRGNYVLIDFWASWCRPCRVENPNLVALYNKYKDKNFTIFSVSLDDNKFRWERAIKEDGLVWENHVSDLLGWQTSVAPYYGIYSIPFTVLVDKDGKIIAKNLRGEQLEQKLKEILG